MAKAKAKPVEPVTDYWEEVNSLVQLATRRKLAESKRWANVEGIKT